MSNSTEIKAKPYNVGPPLNTIEPVYTKKLLYKLVFKKILQLLLMILSLYNFITTVPVCIYVISWSFLSVNLLASE